MKRLRAKNIYPIAIGAIFLTIAGSLIAFDNPFKAQDQSFLLKTTTQENVVEEEEEKAETSSMGVYSTKYGDKVTGKTEKKAINTILDNLFNVSFRTVKADPDAYKLSVLEGSSYIFTDFERGEEGFVKNDPMTPVEFADILTTVFSERGAEVKVSFKPEYKFSGSYGDTYVNGKLAVTFFAGKDLDDFAAVFGITNPELNKAYTSDFCIGYVTGEDDAYKITDLVPRYVEPEEVYGN